MKLKLISEPLALPVTIDEAKDFYRVIETDEDDVITMTITAATEKAEQITNRQLVQATYELYFDSFQNTIKIPRPPLVSVGKIEYIDVNGDVTLFTDYTLDDIEDPAVIYIDDIPSDVETEGINNVIVTFTSGYETTPSAIKSWILIYGLTIFENRENIAIGVSVDDSQKQYYDHLLDSYRIMPI